ncbi:MAG TPA: ABC transporter substrate-binding protein, partial [Sediminispirochaeta sp.]|nr:ABC transporter substrate-binding protein [Sediminispirochaeta sp.]
QGGTLRLHSIGTYDNFHRYALRGVAATGSTRLYDTLMAPSEDEIDVLYPLIAEKVEYPDDYRWVIFHLNPEARFQDGQPIEAEDVIFSFNTFMEKGVPQFRRYFSGVETVEALDRHRVKYSLSSPSKELIMAIAGNTVLPQHYWEGRDFSEPLTEVPMGSGPYTISDFRIGRYLVYQRLEDYWARDLAVNRGRLNFDFVRYDYYRDENVAFEAFKAGEYDYYQENIAKNWATLYTGENFNKGYIVKEEIPHDIPQPMQAFVFNIQRPMFQDRRVRRAISYALDFEWMNKNLFYDQYRRTRSYFQNTKYEAQGLPSAEERRILQPIRSRVPPEVFDQEFQPPRTDGSGNIRPQMREALSLFREAGWEIKNRRMVNTRTGEPMEFELLLYSTSMERVAVPFQQNLERLGITMNIRVVDTTQFTNRLRERDFDLISGGYSANPYPSSDLQIIWHGDFIDSTYNTAGVQDPAVDYLVEGIVEHQEDEEALLHWGRALDRVLTWNHYVIPQWHIAKFRIAYWDKFSRPETRPKYSLGLDTWWFDRSKQGRLPGNLR